ncbi:hypothetical protein ES703_60335 [subsurface metagenome]
MEAYGWLAEKQQVGSLAEALLFGNEVECNEVLRIYSRGLYSFGIKHDVKALASRIP